MRINRPTKITIVDMNMNHMADVGLIKMLIFHCWVSLGVQNIINCEFGMIGLQKLLKSWVRVILTSKFST